MSDRINPKSRNKRTGEARYKKETRTTGHLNPSGSYSIPLGNRRTMTGKSENRNFQKEAAKRVLSPLALTGAAMSQAEGKRRRFVKKANAFTVVPPGIGGRVEER